MANLLLFRSAVLTMAPTFLAWIVLEPTHPHTTFLAALLLSSLANHGTTDSFTAWADRVMAAAAVMHCLVCMFTELTWVTPNVAPLGVLCTWLGLVFYYASKVKNSPRDHVFVHVFGAVNNLLLLWGLRQARGQRG